MAIRIPLGACIILVRRKEKRIPTSGFALLGMTAVVFCELRRFIPLPQCTKLKPARKTEITCHCEERGTSDVAIRIPLGAGIILVRRKEKRIPTSGFALSRRRLCRLVPLGRMTVVW